MAAVPTVAMPDPQVISEILVEVRTAAKSSCRPDQFKKMQGALLAWTVDGCEPDGWHWFCDAPHTPLPHAHVPTAQTQPLVAPLATFLLTLFAYNVNPSIARFRTSLAALLGRCPACVRGYVTAKRALEDQYLRDQSGERIGNFMRTLTNWEVQLLGDAAIVRWRDVAPTLGLLVVLDAALSSHADVIRIIDAELDAQAAQAAAEASAVEDTGLFAVAPTRPPLDYGSSPVFGEGMLSLLLPARGASPSSSAAPDRLVDFALSLLPHKLSITPGSDLSDSLPALERLLSLVTSTGFATPVVERDAWRALHALLLRLSPSAIDSLLSGGDGALKVDRNERWLDDHCRGGSGELWAGLASTLCSKLGAVTDVDADGYGQSMFAHSSEPAWLEILECFAVILREAQAGLWLPPRNAWLSIMRGRKAPDPVGTLDSITGSQALLTLLSTQPAPKPAEIAKPLSIFLPFVKSVLRPAPAPLAKPGPFDGVGKGKAAAGPEGGVVDLVDLEDDEETLPTLDPKIGADAVKKVVWFLCENLQHPRFGAEVRTAAMMEGIKVLEKAQEILQTYAVDHAARRSVNSLLDIHSATLSALVCGVKEFRDAAWSACRQRARGVVSVALNEDSAAVLESLMRLAKIVTDGRSRRLGEDGLPLMPIAVRIRSSLWAKMYDSLAATDLEGTAMVIRAVTKVAHLDVLGSGSEAKAWDFNKLNHTEQRRQSRKTAEDFNAALAVVKGDRLARMIERFANANASSKLIALWNMPGLTSAATVLFLSPLEDIHNAVQTLVQETFDDVNDRADCFRALLRAMPEEAVRGLTDTLITFIESALTLPEANSMAKWMVLCLTDVVDVLCRGARSLFREDAFINHAGVRPLVPRLWRYMSKALALLFRFTPHWAEFFDSQAMTEWMRDALIFARAMVEQMRTFEGAAVGGLKAVTGESWQAGQDGGGSPVKLGKVGKVMVEALKEVLTDLVVWLRLTDQEILYQAFELIKLLLDRFHRADVAPGEGVSSTNKNDPLVKLPKFIQRRTGYRCKLADTEMAELSEMLGWWEKFDEDVIKYEGEEVTFEGESSRSATAKAPASSGRSSRATSDDEFGDDIIVLSDRDLRNIDAVSRQASSGSAAPKLKQSLLKPLPMSRPISKSAAISTFTKPSASSSSSAAGKMSFGSTKGSMKTKPSGLKTQAMKNLRSEFRSTVAPPKGGLKAGFHLGSRTASEVEPPRRKRWADTASSGASSSDSSDTDEGAETRGLAGLAQASKGKAPEPPRKVAPAPRRTIMMADDEVRIRNPQQIRRDQREAARRTKLRLKPDMEDLHRQILRWDPRATGDRPPEAANTRFRPLPDTFGSPQEYVDVLQPLFMLESWAQLQKGIEENQNEMRVAFDVLGKSVVDDWVDVEVVVPSGQIDQRYRLSEVDVVLVTGVNPAVQDTSAYARVVVFKKTFQDVQITLRFHNSANLTGFAPRSKWRLQKIMSLSTMHREWASLKGMPYYDSILPAVLRAQSHPIVEVSRHDVKDAMDAYAVNEPQARAILGAMNPNATGFVLIQGPPGTGKTKTIGGLVGKFLSDRPTPAVNFNTNRDGTMYGGGGGQAQAAAKLLVCAPSNAAIDEVCRRLKEGLRSATGRMITPKVVRMGHEDSMNIAVKDVSLDELIDQKLKDLPAQNKGEGAAEVAQIRQELDALQHAKNETLEKLRTVADDPAESRLVEEELRRIGSKRSTLAQKLNKAKDQQRDNSRALDAARRKARYEVINEADIICSTLSGAGHDLLSDCDFETVIIDEAAQAVELSALIPLKYNCKRCIMVGDPNQLPPTVLSRRAEDYKYSESMFVRVQRQSPRNVHLLSIQYRMHPDISILPSRVFYDGKLADGPNMAQKTLQPWHASHAFAPYRFYNVDAGRESAGSIGHSLKNTAEANVALAIYQNLKAKHPDTDFDFRIGIVTMYKEQKRELIRVFSSRYGRNITSTVDFNTVDGFQGQEKDIIILSCVRAGGPAAGVGFLKDSRRMNVALTRAKSSLFILGHAPTLEGGGLQWNGIVVDARARNALFDYSPQVFNAPPRIASSHPADSANLDAVVTRNPYIGRPVPSGPAALVPAKRALASGAAGPSAPAKAPRMDGGRPTSGDPSEDLRRMMMDGEDDPYPNRGAPSPSPPPPEPKQKPPPQPTAPPPGKAVKTAPVPPPSDLRKLGGGGAPKRPSTSSPAASSSKVAAGGLRPPPKPPAAGASSTSIKSTAAANGLAPPPSVSQLLKKPAPQKLVLPKRPAPKQDSLFMPSKRKVPPAQPPSASATSGTKPPPPPTAMSARERLNLSAKAEHDTALSKRPLPPPPARR